MNTIDEILQELINGSGSQAAFIGSGDGMAMASVNTKDEDRMAAMTATLMSMGQKFISDLELGGVEQIYIKTGKNFMLFKEVKENVVLGIVSGESTKLGMLLYHLDNTVKKLNEVL